jgi:hypothetical protein
MSFPGWVGGLFFFSDMKKAPSHIAVAGALIQASISAESDQKFD